MTNWISAKEQRPSYGVPVLVTCGKEIDLCELNHTDAEGDHYQDARHEEFHDVTHWMPLPELPK